MDEVFEYRLQGRRRTTWLAAIGVAAMISLAVEHQTPMVVSTIWGLTAAMIVMLLLRNPIAGIRVDDKHFILAAWRRPKLIPLSSIDHLRVNHWTDDSDMTIVYRDGTEEQIPNGDLPSVQILSEVLAERGIAIKDPIA